MCYCYLETDHQRVSSHPVGVLSHRDHQRLSGLIVQEE